MRLSERVERLSRRAPSRPSSSLTWRDTSARYSPSWLAAMVKEPARTTRTKLSMVRKRSTATSIVVNYATITYAFSDFYALMSKPIVCDKGSARAPEKWFVF